MLGTIAQDESVTCQPVSYIASVSVVASTTAGQLLCSPTAALLPYDPERPIQLRQLGWGERN
jgi:hypothetical protein